MVLLQHLCQQHAPSDHSTLHQICAFQLAWCLSASARCYAGPAFRSHQTPEAASGQDPSPYKLYMPLLCPAGLSFRAQLRDVPGARQHGNERLPLSLQLRIRTLQQAHVLLIWSWVCLEGEAGGTDKAQERGPEQGARETLGSLYMAEGGKTGIYSMRDATQRKPVRNGEILLTARATR